MQRFATMRRLLGALGTVPNPTLDPALRGSGPGRVRPTVRLKLALLCGGLVVLAGTIVLLATYFLLTPGLPGIGVFLRGTTSTRPVNVRATVSISGPAPSACAAAIRALAEGRPPLPAGAPTAAGGLPIQRTLVHVKQAAQPAQAAKLVTCLRAWAGVSGRITSPEQVVGLFVHQVSATQRALDMRQLLARGALAIAVLAFFSLAAGWWMAGRLLRPLQVMTRRVQELSERTPLGRIRLAGPDDELKRLADTFDGLLARLDAALAADRTFVANASHELRTPLAIQETILDVALADPAADVRALREMGERLRRVNARSGRLIEGLLALARSQQGPDRWEGVDLGAIAEAAREVVAAEAAQRQVRLEADIQPAAVRGDPVLLERLACNLLQNAVRHNVAGGWARVSTSTGSDGAVLTVSNAGPVVDASEVDRLFQPFHRGGRERTDSAHGAGLGLSIVRAVAEAHGGTVTAQPRPDGGLNVTVALPPVSAD